MRGYCRCDIFHPRRHDNHGGRYPERRQTGQHMAIMGRPVMACITFARWTSSAFLAGGENDGGALASAMIGLITSSAPGGKLPQPAPCPSSEIRMAGIWHAPSRLTLSIRALSSLDPLLGSRPRGRAPSTLKSAWQENGWNAPRSDLRSRRHADRQRARSGPRLNRLLAELGRPPSNLPRCAG